MFQIHCKCYGCHAAGGLVRLPYFYEHVEIFPLKSLYLLSCKCYGCRRAKADKALDTILAYLSDLNSPEKRGKVLSLDSEMPLPGFQPVAFRFRISRLIEKYVPYGSWLVTWSKKEEEMFPQQRSESSYDTATDRAEVADTYQDRENLFLASGGVLNQPKNQVHGVTGISKNIFYNKSAVAWTNAQGTHRIVDLHNNHLVSLMRWLVANWQELRRHYVNEVERLKMPAKAQSFMDNHLQEVMAAQTAVSFYSSTLVPFGNIAEEIIRRFGPRALTSLYDGN